MDSTEDKSKAAIALLLARESDAIEHRLRRCESPIERLFCLHAMLNWTDAHEPLMPWPDFVPEKDRGADESSYVEEYPLACDILGSQELFTRAHQHWAAAGLAGGALVGASEWTELDIVSVLSQPELQPAPRRIRLDVAVVGRDVKLAIELDGHDFHERTKEQAAKDKSRDRILVALGWKVLRFTGSEVYRDPAGCVFEVAKLLTIEGLRRRCCR